MPTYAKGAQGTTLGGAGASNIVGTITSISLGGVSTAEIDVTGLGDSAKQYIMGTLDGGTVEISAIVTGAPGIPTSGDTTADAYTLTFGTPAVGNASPRFSFNAFIQQVSVEASVDGVVTATYTLRITGAVTVTAVTS